MTQQNKYEDTTFYIHVGEKFIHGSLMRYLNEKQKNEYEWHITSIGKRIKVYKLDYTEAKWIVTDEDYNGQYELFILTEEVLIEVDVQDLKAYSHGEDRIIEMEPPVKIKKVANQRDLRPTRVFTPNIRKAKKK